MNRRPADAVQGADQGAYARDGERLEAGRSARQARVYQPSRRLYARVDWPLIALACLSGNLIVQQLPDLPTGEWLVPGALVFFAAAGVRRLRLLCFALAAMLWTVCACEARLDARLPAELAGRDVKVTGWIDDFPRNSPARTVFTLRVEQADFWPEPGRVRLSWYEAPLPLSAGMRLELTLRLKPPRGLSNPGGFDYERWSLLQGYGATGYVRAGRVLQAQAGWRGAWLGVRQRLMSRIDRADLGPGATALLRALVVGERSQFSDAQWDALRRTGTSHLVAISGMHIGLIATLVFGLTRRVSLRLPAWLACYDLEVAAAASALAASIYAGLAGFALPTQRALVMLLVALYVVVSRRQIRRCDGLALALILVLAFDPLASLSGSFWLSFTAVAVLLALTAVRSRSRWPRLRGLASFCRLQGALTLGLMPLVVIYFGEASVAAPFVNFLAVPLFGLLLVPLSLLGAALMPLDTGMVLQVAGKLADLFWYGIQTVGAETWSARVLPVPAPFAVLLACVAVMLALPWHALPRRRLAWCALASLVVSDTDPTQPGSVAGTVIDVGHGLAVLIETAQHRMLYDAGPLYRSGFDAGGEIVVPMLQRRPRPALDLILIGHADADHAGGARAVLRAFPDARIVKGPDVGALRGEPCHAGMAWTWDRVDFELLHPPPGFTPQGNETSCVLKVTSGEHALLVTGDIERRAETLLSASASIDADVVVVPHHGSATSSSRSFVAAVSPELAIVSAAHDNRWNFPRPEVVRRWQDAGAQLLTTGDVGAVRIEMSPTRIVATAERQRRHRYWHAESLGMPGESIDGAL